MMRKGILVLCFVVCSAGFLTRGGVNPNSFYEYSGVSKAIAKLQTELLSGQADFTYGLQNYNQNKIISSACFYNQPSNTLHYVLTNDENHTLHFLIPVLKLDHVNLVESNLGDKLYVELVYNDDLGMKVKEHSDEGRIVFRLQYTSFPMPIDDSIDADKVLKRFNKLIKKAKKFQSK